MICLGLYIYKGDGSEFSTENGHESGHGGTHLDGEFIGSSVNAKLVSRKGSGASVSSIINLSALKNGKQICRYKHLHLLKLNEIKRVGFSVLSSC